MSLVWNYFKVSTADKKLAICNDCKALVPRGGSKVSSFNTTNLISHLQMKHSEIHNEYKQKVTEREQLLNRSKTTQLLIPEAAEKKQLYPKDHPRAKGITGKIVECVALDNQPFSIVEDTGFTNLLEYMDPRFGMPSRKVIVDEGLPKLYSSVHSRLEALLSGAVFISFTTDIWSSSVNQTSMLSLTAQWLDDNFVLKKAVLHSQECRGSHTGVAIASAFEAMFDSWHIPKEKIHVVVRDNARNMAKATVEFGVASLPCMAHTLQLAVNGGALDQRSIAEALAVGRKMIGHFKHSPLAYDRLENLQKEFGLPVKKLQQDVATRWNSTLYMMQSLVEQKRPLTAYGADYGLPATLTSVQWGIMEKMITLLEPFEHLTKTICCAQATAADLIPGVVSLKRLLGMEDPSNIGVKTAQRLLLEAVGDRFHSVQTEPLYAIATMVDPRYKDCYFDADKKEGARNMLLKVVADMAKVSDGDDQQGAASAQGEAAQGEAAGSSAEQGQEDQESPPKRARKLQDMYQEIRKENEVSKTAATGETASQVHLYLGEETLKEGCPLAYWGITKGRFPAVARVARKYLTAPCTSVDSERLFSTVAQVINERRNRIHPENAEKLVFIQKNLPLTHNIKEKGKKN